MSAIPSARLGALLRYFRLPSEATSADLRKAYLEQAKRLHPDRRSGADRQRAAGEFAELKEHFEEANALLGRAEEAGMGSGRWEFASTYTTRTDPPWQRNSTGGGQSQFRRWSWEDPRTSQRKSQHWTWAEDVPPQSETGPFTGRSPSAVPVEGFPAAKVYAFVGIFFGAVVASVVDNWWKSRKLATAVDANTEVRDVQRLRQAVENPRVSWWWSRFQRETPAPVTTATPASSSDDDEVVLDRVNAAAKKDEVWWIERCGASPKCCEALNFADVRGDTPLHYCAKAGATRASCALLRAGCDPDSVNRWHLWPEDLAAHGGHAELAQVLRWARLHTANGASQMEPREVAIETEDHRLSSSERVRRLIGRHPDGLGMRSVPPADLYFDGLHPSESLRHAINHAAGRPVLEKLSLAATNVTDVRIANGSTAISKSDSSVVELALARIRTALHETGVILEELPADTQTLGIGGSGWRTVAATDLPGGKPSQDFSNASSCGVGSSESPTAVVVSGLLVFEPPGVVSGDACGHWHAVRPFFRSRQESSDDRKVGVSTGTDEGTDGSVSQAETSNATIGSAPNEAPPDENEVPTFFRLDSIRGVYVLTKAEFAGILGRYSAWRVMVRQNDIVRKTCQDVSSGVAE
eukprot:TRINITY_DN61282_c0_g1_i1.p1 TRINITY_DN61282_c0_g1~~TRINITY_DN61282_c0_g1_i1.p1  ORF type:complete len:638 (-),score=91.91 TRINITY_DN61282_c0_g1_i1:59-1972(-)